MKISLNWLKDYVDVKQTSQSLVHMLTMAGLEVTAIQRLPGDCVFEIEITSNRPDWLSIVGVAREVAAITGKTLKLPVVSQCAVADTSSEKVKILIQDKKACTRYIGTLINDVTIKDSPAWLKQRIETIGLRPVNNAVDLTNFCLMETGQPMHAFDYDRLAGGKLIVRRAKKGESIITIDGVMRTLDSDILVIADRQKPVAIAGIMGGAGTEVTATTKNILLESAYFDPLLIRRASRKLGLSSESSYRFERFVDYEGVASSSLRATRLLCELTKGRAVALKDIKQKQPQLKEIPVDMRAVQQLIGKNISLAQSASILKKLGFRIKTSKNSIKATPPGFRRDVQLDVDIIEEIARCFGYENIPYTHPFIKPIEVASQPETELRPTIKEILAAQGLREVITYSLIPLEFLSKTNLSSQAIIAIKNPLSREQEILRPTLLPSLISCMSYNFRRNQKDLKIFEISNRHIAVNGQLQEEPVLAIGLSGEDVSVCLPDNKVSLSLSLFHLKGAVEALLNRLGIENAAFKPSSYPAFSKETSTIIRVEGKKIGVLGRVSSEILEKFDYKTKSDVFLAELYLNELYPLVKLEKRFTALNIYPEVARDISLVVSQQVSFAQIEELITTSGHGLLQEVQLIDYYLGGHIPKGSKGITLSLTFQAEDRTLSDMEVNSLFETIRQELKQTLNAEFR
ncbi:phenylalanine--tRNA ligase subunit beta [Candidatus Omnitrophota bacterium]